MMKKIPILATIAFLLAGCSAAGEIVGGTLVALPDAIDNVQREQQTGPYRPRTSSSVFANGMR